MGVEVADAILTCEVAEDQFAALVDALAANDRGDTLTALLAEDHAVYDQRGTGAIVRMRGWVLLALGRGTLPPAALIFVLEELDTGHDGYLVAAAARALRAGAPRAEFAPFVMRAIGNLRFRDDPIAFDEYGAYATSPDATTPIRELLETLAWLGPLAREIYSQLDALRTPGSGLSKKLMPDLERTLEAVGPPSPSASARLAVAGAASDGSEVLPPTSPDCCDWRSGVGGFVAWPFAARAGTEAVRATVFEDHNGEPTTFADFFTGQPSIVAFFYTRCDNPQKCSLTVSKLARVQQQLADRGVAERIRTAAITYDPGFDLPSRLRAYGHGRQMRMDADHRLLRTTDGIEPLRRYFSLGVNFIGSLVNRHRIEIYILDAAGRIAATFRRIHWNERDVVDRAVELLNGDGDPGAASRDSIEHTRREPAPPEHPRAAASVLGTLASLGVAFFPKCPICWATYMSALGISSLVPIPYSPWLQPVLFGVMTLNLAAVGWRGRSTKRMTGFALVAAGALAVVATKLGAIPEQASMLGVALTMAGSFASTRT
jgi:protein SCO1